MGEVIYYSEISGRLAARDRARQASQLQRKYTSLWLPQMQAGWRELQNALPASLGLPVADRLRDDIYYFPPRTLRGIEYETHLGEAKVGSAGLSASGVLDPDHPAFDEARAALRQINLLGEDDALPSGSRAFSRICHALGEATDKYLVTIAYEGETPQRFSILRPDPVDGIYIASLPRPLEAAEGLQQTVQRNLQHMAHIADMLVYANPTWAS